MVESPQTQNTVAIVGLGLIGASLALALKPHYRIIGYDLNPDVCRYVSEHKTVDEILPVKEFAGAECVIICTPVAEVRKTAEQVYAAVGDSAVITDVCSVKSVLNGCRGRVVGGHPMAGTEHSGIEAAKPHLFENARYCVVPYGGSVQDGEDVKYVCRLAELVKAIPTVISVAEHDRLAADFSHAPHLIAYALSGSAINGETEIAGSGFMDCTRIACSDEIFWTEVCRLNRQNVLNSLGSFCRELSLLKNALENENYGELERRIKTARAKRLLLDGRHGRGSGLSVCVDIVDKVGSLDGVVKLLCAANVNIANIRILNSREGVGGALSITLSTVKDAYTAEQTLAAAGYTVY